MAFIKFLKTVVYSELKDIKTKTFTKEHVILRHLTPFRNILTVVDQNIDSESTNDIFHTYDVFNYRY